MMEMKRERMGVFVEGAREEIRGLWEELMVGEGERAFAGMDDGGLLSLSMHSPSYSHLY